MIHEIKRATDLGVIILGLGNIRERLDDREIHAVADLAVIVGPIDFMELLDSSGTRTVLLLPKTGTSPARSPASSPARPPFLPPSPSSTAPPRSIALDALESLVKKQAEGTRPY
jgi:hypothetical protein